MPERYQGDDRRRSAERVHVDLHIEVGPDLQHTLESLIRTLSPVPLTPRLKKAITALKPIARKLDDLNPRKVK